MQFKNIIPNLFRDVIHQRFEADNFVLVLIRGVKVNFIIINERFSENVHDRVCFSATSLASNKHAKILIQEIVEASPLCGRFRVIVWNLHFKCQNDI